MAGFHASPPPPPSEPEDRRGARIGRTLFLIYLVFYCGYVFSTAFASHLLEGTLGGINLSVVYGLGLIALAIIMALLYDWLCRPRAESPDSVAPEGDA